jgi:hypothetical protein
MLASGLPDFSWYNIDTKTAKIYQINSKYIYQLAI